MGAVHSELSLRTTRTHECVDVTEMVRRAVAESAVEEGLCCVFVPHTTAGVCANEHFDPCVPSDIQHSLARQVPEDAHYDHPEGNAPAHVKTAMVGSSLTLPVSEGDLALGQWQGVYFMEFDGPRTRRFVVTVVG